jgi:soluble lytic murein transglycosylase
VKRFLVVPILAIAFFGTMWGQDGNSVDARITRSIEQRDRASLLADLRTFQSSNLKAFTSANYDYLLGRTAEAEGELATAMANYQAVVNRRSMLSPYALRRMSQIARSTGNLLLERLYLQQLETIAPRSLISPSARLRLAQNALETGNYGETLRLLNGASHRPSNVQTSNDTVDRQVQSIKAEALLRSGQTAEAREIFAKLSEVDPSRSDDFAVAAVEALDNMAGEELSQGEHLRRANIYQANREFERARGHFRKITDADDAPGAVFQIGRGFMQERNFVAAISEFERIRELYPSSSIAWDALLQAAAAYARGGKSREASVRYQQFIEANPDDERLDRAYMNVVDILRDQGMDADALKWCARARDVFRGKTGEALARFAEVRIYIAKEDWAGALAALDELGRLPNLGGVSVAGGADADEVTFLRAFVLEQLGRYSESIDAYLSIPDGMGQYHGGLATQRLLSMAGNETSRSFVDQKLGVLAGGMTNGDPRIVQKNANDVLRLTNSADLRQRAEAALKHAVSTGYPKVPELKIDPKIGKSSSTLADELIKLGLYDEAAPEIDADLPAAERIKTNTAYTLAKWYNDGDRGDKAIAFIEPIWRKLPADYAIALIPREQLELLYPAPYRQTLVEAASQRKLDPRLLLAIMRQESRFQPDAKSRAAARGLMQFITSTAERISNDLGRDRFDRENLYDPSSSILLGAQYVAGLFALFPEQPEAVAASYNGGEDNMKRWLTRSRSSLPERYVPEIAFAQTKDYVYKVMANYRMYQYLYDEQLRLR